MVLVVGAMPRESSAATSLGLVHRDYPKGSHIVVVPATNVFADRYLQPAHRSSFEHLHRLDGVGWLQFATWHFSTGAGKVKQQHQTNFGYGINVFKNHKAAKHAVADVKLPTTISRVAHLPARRFRSTDATRTLVFVFFVYRTIEVEAYYEYTGVAPLKMAHRLRHTFSTQSSHLAHLVRKLLAAPTPTSTPMPAATDTPTETATMTPAATVTPTSPPAPSATPTSPPAATAAPRPSSTPTPTRTPTPRPSPTATATPVVATVTATLGAQRYRPGAHATVTASVTSGGSPVAGALVNVTFSYPDATRGCDAVTDASGQASCFTVVPAVSDGTPVQVTVDAVYGGGQTASTSLLFYVYS